MSPAVLTSLDPGVALEPVADDHLAAIGPEEATGDVSPPRPGDLEGRRRLRHRRPEPHLLLTLPPRGLVDVRRGRPADICPQLLGRDFQVGGGMPLRSADHPGGDRQAEQVGGQLADRALAQAIGPGQDAEDRPEPWPERPGGHARRQLRTGGGAASWAGQAMEPVLVDHRADRRQLGDLMPERLGVVPGQGVAAPAASGRLALDDLAQLLGRDQGACMTSMAGSSAPLLARGRGRGPPLDRGRIGGRGPGRVGRVAAALLLQCGDPALEGVHQLRDGRFGLGREGVPDGLSERRVVRHAAVLRVPRLGSNIGP